MVLKLVVVVVVFLLFSHHRHEIKDVSEIRMNGWWGGEGEKGWVLLSLCSRVALPRPADKSQKK